MYPLHKYLPTPFGTYLLYIDNGASRVNIGKWQARENLGSLPPYQKVKEYRRRQQIQASQTHGHTEVSSTAPVNAPQQNQLYSRPERRKEGYSSTSSMPNSIWNPKVKRQRPSYNMRYLWHDGQPLINPPASVVKVDDVTGAEVQSDASWYKNRPQKYVDMIHYSVMNSKKAAEMERSVFPRQTDELSESRKITQEKAKGKQRLRAPPNTVSHSRQVSESYKRRASSLRNDMVPRMQRKNKNPATTGQMLSRQNKWTQTTPGIKNTVTTAESILPKIGISVMEKRSRYEDMPAALRSQSVPLDPNSRASRKRTDDRDCVQKTGLPPIAEAVVSDYIQVPKTVATLPDSITNQFRRVQELRSASPTFPIVSKQPYWEKTGERAVGLGGKGGSSLLPFAWKESSNRETEGKLMEAIAPMVTRIHSVPRVAPWKA